ncbi:hypothetical protein MIT9_P0027 [Methylomarinovum caldicuralii]|uniref:DUF423 domain-containing protein n=1 Tax=Methylomarinovum caldicuralii TaxID=438856 RepID=A0AAU9C092_9GAMM|nr:DUF423 domain-containing protein [Methylomarinovum caldicuralii]BCX80454.1 hypothetical protein MIT9_P0027 [Methylomarinovum caldicuralii]
MNRQLLGLAAGLAGLAVMLGAFGAHGLQSRVSEHFLSVWQTAVRYQMWHALGLGLIAVAAEELPSLRWSVRLMLLGIVVFCGTLYLLVLSGWRWLGMITPIGGLALIAAWLLLAWQCWRGNDA